MSEFSISLWLPVGRANFYSTSANGWLFTPGENGDRRYYSNKIADPKYVPVLQGSVLRRVLEVLPLSFGYEHVGIGETAGTSGDDDEPDEVARPVSITIALSDVSAHLYDPGRKRANEALGLAGIHRVEARVDELGNYSFTASFDGPLTEAVRQALRTHVHEVFGGAFDVSRLVAHRGQAGQREGAAAVRRYNGLYEQSQPGADDDPSRDVLSRPLGILTFFQLNTLFEGVANLTLSPAVFFERYAFLREWEAQKETAVTLVKSIGDFIALIETTQDGRQKAGRVIALRRFLAVTSRETLQKMKWSVESVRRNLLNEMMSVLHRQSRLVQLDLAAIKRERTPELAGDASETQLRGYVTLAAAKLPLIANVYEVARIATDRLTANEPATGAARQLQVELEHWKLLLDGLDSNVASLEKAVEQAWMERLLYEQQQSRSEQEAISEIERSRYGQPAGAIGGSGGGGPWESWNFILALLSILFVLVTTDPSNNSIFDGDVTPADLIALLGPIALVGVVYLVVFVVRRVGRARRLRSGDTGLYSYEFAFVLDEPTRPDLVMRQLRPSPSIDAPHAPASLRSMMLRRLGGGRIERVSTDSSSIKMHSIVTFPVGRHRARFEIVHEIRASLVSDEKRYHIHQIRVFGESPEPLPAEKTRALIDWIYLELSKPLFEDTPHDDFHPAGLLKDLL